MRNVTRPSRSASLLLSLRRRLRRSASSSSSAGAGGDRERRRALRSVPVPESKPGADESVAYVRTATDPRDVFLA